jgi:DNA polymerase I
MLPFREIVLADFEYIATPGERPVPVCAVGHELCSGRCFRIWQDKMLGPTPPWASGPDVLFVAYYASAELGNFLVLNWPMPTRILDLFVEFRHLTNGLNTPAGKSLLGALAYFGLDSVGTTEKKEMQEAIGAGAWQGRFSQQDILNYCEGDVAALKRLFVAMLPRIDLSRALLRGRFMAACAHIEYAGVPIDTDMLALLREHWTDIQDRLITEIDSDYGVFEGRTFKTDRFAAWLATHKIPWPMLESGNLALDDDTFRQQAKAYPSIAPLRELRSALSDLRLRDLSVGRDHRNRTILSAFGARSGRNTPSNSKFIFGPSVWLRNLIKPPPGYAVVYLDWKQQEFGIAGALSGDAAMVAAYQSGDPYLSFGKQAGVIPADANKATHGIQRELCKQTLLAVQYGMEADALAARIGQPPIVARNLLRVHRETYSTFWRWSNAAVDQAMLTGKLNTVFGWAIHIGEKPNPRSLRNFPMQANGAEMLRVACCLATERGIEVCAPVHDAVLIASRLEDLEANVAGMRAAMAEASRAVLSGFELTTDCLDEFDEHGKHIEFPHIIRHPRRYMDSRGAVMWDRVTKLLGQSERGRLTA